MSTVEGLFADLRLSYIRHHESEHLGDFADCGEWGCMNHREKLAEWRVTLDEQAKKNDLFLERFSAAIGKTREPFVSHPVTLVAEADLARFNEMYSKGKNGK